MSGNAQGMFIAGLFLPLPLLLALTTLFGACIPLLFNKLFLSRKDRNDFDQKRFENSRELLAESTAKANDFEAAIGKALRKPKPTIDDVMAIMKSGEVYFATLTVMAQAVLDDRVSPNARTHDFVPRIAEALEKSLPAYYETLRGICSKLSIPFEGEFTEENYESLFRVADQYDRAACERVRSKFTVANP